MLGTFIGCLLSSLCAFPINLLCPNPERRIQQSRFKLPEMTNLEYQNGGRSAFAVYKYYWQRSKVRLISPRIFVKSRIIIATKWILRHSKCNLRHNYLRYEYNYNSSKLYGLYKLCAPLLLWLLHFNCNRSQFLDRLLCPDIVQFH